MTEQSVPASQTGWTDKLFNMASADAQQGNFLSTVYAGVYIGAVSFAIHLATFVWAVFALRRGKRPRTYTSAGLLLLVSLLFACALLNEACNAAFNAHAWRADDGTANATFHYFMLNQPARLNGAAIVGALLSTLLADSFLLVRCYQWWKNLRAFIPLALCFILSLVWDILAGSDAAGHARELYSIWVMPIYVDWSIAGGIFGALHVLYSAYIAGRAVHLRRNGKTPGAPRPSVWALAVESALVYALVSLVFMALYCANAMAANALIPLLVQLQGITVDLIVIRIATQQSPSPLLPTSVIAPGLVGVVLPPPPSPSLSNQSSRTSIAKSDSTSRKDSTSARGWSPDTKAPPPPEYSP